MICAVFGHRKMDTPVDEEKLKNLFLSMITKDCVDTFYFGYDEGFDRLCHALLTKLRKKYPHVRLVYCLSHQKHAFHGRKLPSALPFDYAHFLHTPLANDDETSFALRDYAIVDESDFLLFYDARPSNDTRAYEYAKSKNKKIFTLYP